MDYTITLTDVEKLALEHDCIDIKDWKTKGDYVLLVLQRPGDTSLKNLISIHGSYENFITILKDLNMKTLISWFFFKLSKMLVLLHKK